MWTLLSAALASSYTLSFPERANQRAQIEAELTSTGDSTELFMATWTPGSYLVREFARNVEQLEAIGSDGRALPVRKSAKNRWVVDTTGQPRFTLRYALYADETTVQQNFVDPTIAVLNGAPTFIVKADLQGPYDVTVRPPEDWKQVVTALAPHEGHYRAATYDLLVDSPIVVGNPVVNTFEIDGVPHSLVDFPATTTWDSDKAASAVKRVAQAQRNFWGSFPYERYLYLNWIEENGRGGLEHLDSTLMITHQDNTREDEPFQSWLGLVAHEHFHAWNVKRLRPAALGPFDYENERYTEDLWIAEGFTSYYDDLLLVRAGLIDEAEWRKRMSKNLERLQDTPGRLEQPLSEASFDAWIKHYRPSPNNVNTAISYYTKGAVVAWLCDALIRERTNGAKSLDDVMRLAYQRHAGETGYTSAQFRQAISDVAGTDLGPTLAQWVDTPTELDLSAALAWYGLQLAPPKDADRKTWLGAVMQGGVVGSVLRDTPAWRAGIEAGDEILAIDTHRVTDLTKVLQRYPPGAEVEVLVNRRGQLRRLQAVLGKSPVVPVLEPIPGDKKGAKHREALFKP